MRSGGQVLLLLSFVTLLLGPFWLPGNVLAEGDLLMYFPTLYRAPWQGAWNDLVMCGTPSLPNPQTGAFYPPAWLLAVDYFATWRFYVAGHLALGAIGTWAWVRTRVRTGWGPVVAGLAWAACGPTWSLLTKLDKLPGHAWLPWVLLGASWLPRRPRAGVTWIAVGLAAMWFGGSVEGVVVAGIAAPLWALAVGGPRALGRAVLALATGALLSAVSLVPLLVLLPETLRAGGLAWDEAVRMATHVEDWVRVVTPGHQSGHWLVSLYAGGVALVLGVLGARRGVPAVAGVALFVALALGDQNPLYPALRALPGVGTIQYPEKWWLGAVPFGVWLVALGVERAGRWGPWLALVVAAEGLVSTHAVFAVDRVDRAYASSPVIRALLADWSGPGRPRVWVDGVVRGEPQPVLPGESVAHAAHALLYPNTGARFGIADAYGAWALRGARPARAVAHVRDLELVERVAATAGLGVDYVVLWRFEDAAKVVAAGVARPVAAAPGDTLDVALLALPRGERPTELGPGVFQAPAGTTLPVAWAPGWRASVDGGPWNDVPPDTFLHVDAPTGAVVTYRYVPAGLALGAAGTLAGLGALLFIRRASGTGPRG